MTPLPEGQSVPEGRASTIKWPDRSHRTLAEVWKLSADEVTAVRGSVPVYQTREWSRA